MTAFGQETTADEILEGVSLARRCFLVTGVSSGLGIETARTLVAHGATVVGTVRDIRRAQEATAPIQDAAASGGSLTLVELDLASLASVRSCSDALLAVGQPVDAIIGNAGVMACPQGKTADGFETQFGTNHLGHFVLINRLVPLLGAGSRVVILTSAAHGFAEVDLDDPNFDRRPYGELLAYGQSKTANALFAVEFNRRHRRSGIHAAAAHPGSIRTNLTRHITPEVAERLGSQQKAGPSAAPAPIFWKSVPQGAATSIWAACMANADAVGGRYCADCQVSEIATERTYAGNAVQPYAIDPDKAVRLWSLSEKMVGEIF